MPEKLSLFTSKDLKDVPPIAATAQELEERVLYLESHTMFKNLKERYYQLKVKGRVADAYYLLQEYNIN